MVVLDNCEHVLDGAAAGDRVHVLALESAGAVITGGGSFDNALLGRDAIATRGASGGGATEEGSAAS